MARVQRVQKVQRVHREKVLKMDGPSAQGFLSLTALRAEGCGGGCAASLNKRGAAGAAGCVEGLQKKVLRIDRPDGRRVLKFDGPFGPEGCGLPFGQCL